MKNQDIKHSIGVQIREIRKSRGLTQEQLAESAGITYKYLGLIERGRTNPSIDTLLGIAAGLDISLDMILRTDRNGRTSVRGLSYRGPEEGYYNAIVHDRAGRYFPDDRDRQKLIVQAINLFRRAFSGTDRPR
ncbi:MAG: helix-turn-helix transcriptional regulator [Deltaproteobacteria bacterium]|nr:helix-turn-helix transcriptional regulator [Deltaproteobacteria bacterium]MCL5276500.1 helix-turn-helix transcriptional regulator [Deltaproteobacteria bacterium]